MPEPAYDPKNPGPTHGMILVTNNLEGRNRWGKMSHVWLTSIVHTHEADDFKGHIFAEAGEITAFAEPGGLALRSLTHWRPAVPEEWETQDAPACQPETSPLGESGSSAATPGFPL